MSSASHDQLPTRDDLYYEVDGTGVPVMLIHPAGATADTWGSVTDALAEVGQVITYDRRGYARTGGAPVRVMRRHTADAAALLESLTCRPAVVVGTSAGAAIAVDLAVRRPDLVRSVVAHEFPWRFTRHRPSAAQLRALLRIAALQVVGAHADAAEALLRAAYSYRDGGSAWDDFPASWRRIGLRNAEPALADFRNSIATYPSPDELAACQVPVVCSYGSRSPEAMARLVRGLAAALPNGIAHCLEGSGHAAPFDAPDAFADLIVDYIRL